MFVKKEATHNSNCNPSIRISFASTTKSTNPISLVFSLPSICFEMNSALILRGLISSPSKLTKKVIRNKK